MANLLGQNIGTNYKGILNLNTLNGNLSGTLQAVTDGDGNASPLRLSTTEVLVNSKLTINNTLEGTNSGRMNIVGQFDLAIVAGNSASGIGGVFIGGSSSAPTGRLNVRGDGTNPVARFESSAGANFVTINNSGQLVFGSAGANEPLIVNYNGASPGTESGTGSALRIRQRANLNGTLMQYWADGLFNNTTSGTNISHHFLSSGYAGAAGNGNYRATQIDYTINNSGAQTGNATGIFLNATETALNGMTHNLMDLQAGSTSRFRVGRVHDAAFVFNGIAAGTNYRPLYSLSRIGSTTTAALIFGVGSGGTGSAAFMASSNDDFYLGTDVSSTFTTNIVLKASGVGFVGFGGTTSSFPALKRNAAALEVRLADDTAFAGISALSFTIGGTSTSLAANTLNLAGYNAMFYSSRIYIDNDNRGVAINNNLAIGNGNVATNSSSVLECISTTKGFLPPRMTTTERDLIATPAAGLVIYNTTTNVLNFYNGSAWGAV